MTGKRFSLLSLLIPSLLSLALLITIDQFLGWKFKNEVLESSIGVGERIRSINSLDRDYRYLSFGESVFHQIDSTFAKEDAEGASLLPLATSWATNIAGNYFLFKRYLDRHPPPEAIDIVMNHEVAGNTLTSHPPATDSALLRTFVQWDEIQELQVHLNDKGLLAKQVFYKFFHTASLLSLFRVWTNDLVSKLVKPKPPDAAPEVSTAPAIDPRILREQKIAATKGQNWYFVKMEQLDDDLDAAYKLRSQHFSFSDWQHGGCAADYIILNVKDPQKREQVLKADLQQARMLTLDWNFITDHKFDPRFCMSKSADFFFRRTIELAAENGVRVLFAASPIAESKYKMFLLTGANMGLNAYFSSLERDYSNFIYVPNHFRSYPDHYFANDGIHFNQGEKIFSGFLGPLLKQTRQSSLSAADVFSIENRI